MSAIGSSQRRNSLTTSISIASISKVCLKARAGSIPLMTSKWRLLWRCSPADTAVSVNGLQQIQANRSNPTWPMPTELPKAQAWQMDLPPQEPGRAVHVQSTASGCRPSASAQGCWPSPQPVPNLGESLRLWHPKLLRLMLTIYYMLGATWDNDRQTLNCGGLSQRCYVAAQSQPNRKRLGLVRSGNW